MQTTTETTRIKPTTVTVTCEYGTFTRKTARTYTHIVIGRTVDGDWGLFAWSGRLDLAEKTVKFWQNRLARHAFAIVDVATGAIVHQYC